MTETIQRIVLASRPVGEPTLDNFRLEDILSSFAPQAKTTLHELCRIMGMPGKPEGIHGGEVARYFLEAGSRKSRIIAGPTSLTGIGFGCATNCFVENSRRSSFNLASRSLESSSFSMIRFTNPLVRVAQRLKSPMSRFGSKADKIARVKAVHDAAVGLVQFGVAQRLQSLRDASTPTKADQDILLMIFGSGPPLAFAVQKRPKKNLSPPNGA